MPEDPRQLYREEALELLSELETSLLELEEHPEDQELVGRVFRAMHTIKGSGAMFGFSEIAAFTHELETVYDQVREGRMAVDARLVNLSLAGRDQIRALLDAAFGGEPADRQNEEQIITDLNLLRREQGGNGQNQDLGEQAKPAASPDSFAAAPAPADTDGGPPGDEPGRRPEMCYRINFTPNPNLFLLGGNPLPLLDELRAMGQCRISACTDAVPLLDQIDPAASYLSWEILLTTERQQEEIRDLFIFVEDRCQLNIETLTTDNAPGENPAPTAAAHQAATSDNSKPIPATPAGEPRNIPSLSAAGTIAATIRVDAGRLDKLVNQVGELVTVQARLSRLADQEAHPELSAVAEELEMLTAELRDNTMGVRMMPIGGIFSKFRRLVRDLSQKLEKDVALTTTGEETELDKTVIEKLNDPFVHLIRNCIDHGIEMPAQRLEAGKPARGTVHISAVHSGDSVLIEISDDGAGLDCERLRRKAVERGLIAEQDTLDEQALYQLLFLPGFSTANSVSDLSGRGVGMDVVKRGIESLRGHITIASEQGRGTAVRIRLPLTLAIIESLLVRIADQPFALPLNLVEECIELQRQPAAGASQEPATPNGRPGKSRDLINVRGHLVPYIPLRRHFQISGRPPAIEQVVVTSSGNGNRIGLVVDQVIGEHQAVIKSLGPLYRQVRDVSGATILGDGSVALILDLPNLIEEGGVQ